MDILTSGKSETAKSSLRPWLKISHQSPFLGATRLGRGAGRLGTDFQPRPSGDFAVSDFPELRISTVPA